MLLNRIAFAALAVSTTIALPILDRRQALDLTTTKVRGVNIGGWLVLEPWITPSMFDPYNGAVVDEYTFCANVPDAETKLQQHWASWATLSDFQKIAGSGFNLVRIPVGYWAFQKYEGDTYIQGAADYLEQAIGWARQTGLKVWIDLHGAPQSQNGFDNSGQRLTPTWTDGDSVDATVNVISQISQKYAGSDYSDVVAGVELLNEPMMPALPGGRGATQAYYQQGHDTVRQSGAAPVVMHDGFANPNAWNGFLAGESTGVIVDHHEYQVFSPGDNAMSYDEHVGAVWSRAATWATGSDKYVVCGEWTAAMTDCAKWLNGYGFGARYDGSYESSYSVGSCATKSDIASWDDEMRWATTKYILAQVQAFEQYTAGWIFWNFKTEGSGEWDLFQLLDNDVWPVFW